VWCCFYTCSWQTQLQTRQDPSLRCK
jgi:hypothetical protein